MSWGSARRRTISAAAVTLRYTSSAVSSSPIGTRSWSAMRPAPARPGAGRPKPGRCPCRAAGPGSAGPRRGKQTPRRWSIPLLQHRGDHIARAALHLLVDAHDGLAGEPDAEERHADEEELE